MDLRSPFFDDCFVQRFRATVSLTLHPTHIQAMQAHAERSYPNECCGLLLGTLKTGDRPLSDSRQPSPGESDSTVLVEVKAMDNTWDEQAADIVQDETGSTADRYWIAPEAMLAAMRDARSRQLEVIGIYHSHPNAAALPSECDRRLAWHQYSYIILSVIQGKTADLQSWQLDDHHQFQREALILLEHAPSFPL